MRNIIHCLSRAALLLMAGFSAVALTPLATVTSADPFWVNGRAVSGAGIASVTLAVGNEVATANGPAVLFFADGSSVKLGASSRVRLIGSDARPKVVLLAGSLDYKVVLGSTLSVTNLDQERKSRQVVHGVAQPPAPKAAPRPEDATLSVQTR